MWWLDDVLWLLLGLTWGLIGEYGLRIADNAEKIGRRAALITVAIVHPIKYRRYKQRTQR